MGRKIIIVDDNPVDLKLTSYVLEREGYEVATFGDPDEFLQEFPKLKCDALVLDIEMPKKSGIEVLRKISKQVADKNIKVMMLTGRNEMADVVTAVSFGARDYSIKPLDPLLFVSKTHKLLGDDPEKAKWQQAPLRNSDVPREMTANFQGNLLTISEVEIQFISPWAILPGSPMKLQLAALKEFEIEEIPVVVGSSLKAPDGISYIITAQIVGLKEGDLSKIRVLSFRLNKIKRDDVVKDRT